MVLCTLRFVPHPLLSSTWGLGWGSKAGENGREADGRSTLAMTPGGLGSTWPQARHLSVKGWALRQQERETAVKCCSVWGSGDGPPPRAQEPQELVHRTVAGNWVGGGGVSWDVITLIWHFLFHPSKWSLFYPILQIKTTSLQKNWKAQREKQRCDKNHQVAYLKEWPSWPSCLVSFHTFTFNVDLYVFIGITLTFFVYWFPPPILDSLLPFQLFLNSQYHLLNWEHWAFATWRELGRRAQGQEQRSWLWTRLPGKWSQASHFTRGVTGGEGEQIEVKEDWKAKGAEGSCFPAGERAASRGSQV